MKALVVVLALAAGCQRDCPAPVAPPPPSAPPAPVVSNESKTYRDTLAFVRLGYGDLHDLHARSLTFRTECLSTTLMEQAVRLVPDYNAFDGAKIAAAIEQFRGDTMCWQFSREGSPVIYLEIPYWRSQAEKACPARYDSDEPKPCERDPNDRELTKAEKADLAQRAKTVFELLGAEEVSLDEIETTKMRLWWD